MIPELGHFALIVALCIAVVQAVVPLIGSFRDDDAWSGEPIGEDAWVVRVYHKPFIDWIWGGCFLMAMGGVLAVSDRRYGSPAGNRGTPAQPPGARRSRPKRRVHPDR